MSRLVLEVQALQEPLQGYRHCSVSAGIAAAMTFIAGWHCRHCSCNDMSLQEPIHDVVAGFM
jgi:hypothetical protein